MTKMKTPKTLSMSADQTIESELGEPRSISARETSGRQSRTSAVCYLNLASQEDISPRCQHRKSQSLPAQRSSTGKLLMT